MKDYQNSKIYAVKSSKIDLIYVGSTVNSLKSRLAAHKYNKDTTCRNITCFEDAYIELIENFACTSIKELNKREGEIIRQNKCINKYISGRSQKEYYMDNRDYILNKKKENYIKNKNLIKDKLDIII